MSVDKNFLAPSIGERLKALALVLGFGQETENILAVYKELIYPWANLPIDQFKAKNSAFTTDASPIELSVAYCDGVPELRFSMEVIEEDTSIAGKRKSAIAFVNKIEKLFNLNLDKYHAIEDLFLPENMQGKFAIFQSVRFSPGKPVSFNIHLNPKSRGENNVIPIVKQALERLGYLQGWEAFLPVISRGENLDDIFYFCLDVGEFADNRVKIYTYHKDATLKDITRICRVAQTYAPNEHEAFVDHMTGSTKIFSKWPLIAATAFTDSNQPKTVTTYVPMFAYAHDDQQAYQRIRSYLDAHELDGQLYSRIIDTFKNRELSAGIGMQNWISIQRRSNNKVRWTIYLATESLHVFKPGTW